jgi:hypothetical protein
VPCAGTSLSLPSRRPARPLQKLVGVLLWVAVAAWSLGLLIVTLRRGEYSWAGWLIAVMAIAAIPSWYIRRRQSR